MELSTVIILYGASDEAEPVISICSARALLCTKSVRVIRAIETSEFPYSISLAAHGGGNATCHLQIDNRIS